jgi:hypothetical protein
MAVALGRISGLWKGLGNESSRANAGDFVDATLVQDWERTERIHSLDWPVSRAL